VSDSEFHDDIIYPADYVPKMVAALSKYDNRAVVGLHGILLKQPTPAYYNEAFRHVRRYIHENTRDYQVHVLGTGAVLYDSRVLKARKRLAALAPGAVLRMLADDPAARVDVPHFCAEQGHALLAQHDDPGGVLVFHLRKGG